MSDLEQGIEASLRATLEEAARQFKSGKAAAYPGGEEGWIRTVTENRMNEIRQWLHDPDTIERHLKELNT